MMSQLHIDLELLPQLKIFFYKNAHLNEGYNASIDSVYIYYAL